MVLVSLYLALGVAGSLALTPLCRALARRVGMVAAPKADRWHTRPTALAGGVAIAVPTLALGATVAEAGHLWQLLGCGAAIAAVGLADDLLSLKASTKLIGQIAVASALLFFGVRLHWTTSYLGDAMLTAFWIVGLTNAMNLLDNMDGLCAGTAIVASLFLFLGLMGSGAPSPHTLYLAGFVGATAGFLVFNVHPASVFMGDTGSLFLGLNLAVLPLVARAEARSATDLLSVVGAPVLPLLLPIFDTALVTALRLLSKRRPSQGGRDHTSHRLVAIGLSEPRAVATLWALAAAGGAISLLLRGRDPEWAIMATATFTLALAIFAVYLARVRVYDDTDLAVLKGDSITPLVANFMYKRRVAEVLLDMCLVPLAYYSAYRLRFEGNLFGVNYPHFIDSLPIVLACQLLAIFAVGGYRGMWRHFGMMDAVVFAKGVLGGTIAAGLVILSVYRFENYSRTVFVIYAALLLLLLCGSRASFRLFGEFVERRRSVGRRCLVYGIGGASLATIRDAFGTDAPLKILGFADDDPLRRHGRVGGYPVVGDFAALQAMIERHEVDCVVLNAPRLDAARLAALTEMAEQHELEILRVRLTLEPATSS